MKPNDLYFIMVLLYFSTTRGHCSKLFEKYLKGIYRNIRYGSLQEAAGNILLFYKLSGSFENSAAYMDDEGLCLRSQCNYYCFNGNQTSFPGNVKAVDTIECPLISKLHLFNYTFLNKTLSTRFFGPFTSRIEHFFIYASVIEYIDGCAFQSPNLISVHLEDLTLKHLNKGMFANVSNQFTSFTLIQSNPELKIGSESFLENVKYQIKNLTMQTGLKNVEKIVDQCLFINLENVDLSFNKFEARLTPGSFDQLSVVHNLNLSYSEITFLPENIFSSISRTLQILDLSNNKLTVISSNVFGWQKVTKSLNLFFNDNPWECSCRLGKEMSKLFYATGAHNVYCGNMKNILVTSSEICPEAVNLPVTSKSTTTVEIDPNLVLTSTKTLNTTTTEIAPVNDLNSSSAATESNTITSIHELECHKDYEKQEIDNFSIDWPNSQFDIVKKINRLEVDIIVRTNSNDTFGVLWFSKVTLQYYKMETNHNEYGLGCYGHVERITTVNHLLPEMAYTFCLILKDHLTVSPFSCKSIYIEGDSHMISSPWLTKDMKASGIGVVIISIVLFIFFGILCVFIILKHKPSLLKGSKRVTMQRSDTSNIIVFPEDKTLQNFKLMEEKLASNKNLGFPFTRASISGNSLESIQSYMNPENFNIYETIPAHLSNARYSEIPFKRKRSSNDPLPKIPHTIGDYKQTRFENKIEFPKNQCYETEASVYI